MRQPYSLFVCALVCRNILVFFHHLLIYVVVVLLFSVDLNFNTLLAVPGLFLISLNAIWVAFLLGSMCARYRDIQPLITNVLQILMFVTPIFYPASALGPKGQLMANVNPFFHFVEIVRTPLLGQAPSALTWTFVLSFTVLGWLATLLFMSKYRRRICYWL